MNMLTELRKSSHFIRGRGRLGSTIANGLKSLGITVVPDPELADVIWFCVPEKVIQSETEKLFFRLNAGKNFVHTSGMLCSEDIRVGENIKVASLHPAYSFAEPLQAMPENILWTFEGDCELRNLLRPLINAWKGKWAEISANTKIPYHIACVLMGNLIDVPVGAAEEICRQFGLPFSDMAQSLLFPHLADSVSGDVLKRTTGPAARGDSKTVERETHWLQENLPEYEKVYSLLSSLIQKKKR